MKRFFSSVLVALLIFSILPVANVFAANPSVGFRVEKLSNDQIQLVLSIKDVTFKQLSVVLGYDNTKLAISDFDTNTPDTDVASNWSSDASYFEAHKSDGSIYTGKSWFINVLNESPTVYKPNDVNGFDKLVFGFYSKFTSTNATYPTDTKGNLIVPASGWDFLKISFKVLNGTADDVYRKHFFIWGNTTTRTDSTEQANIRNKAEGANPTGLMFTATAGGSGTPVTGAEYADFSAISEEVISTPTSAPTPVVTSIDVAGPGSITIPTGDTPSTATYTATVKDQSGNPMAGESVTWALEAPVTGVALTSSGNTATISVDKTAVNGSSLNLVATSVTNSAVSKTLTVSLTKAAPVLTSITINGQSSIAVPAAGSAQVAYTYIALDQYGAPIVADVTWSIVESVAGVDVSAAGVVTVANTASAGTFTLKATSGTVSGTKTITLTKAAYSGELAGPTQIPIPPSWSDNSNKRSFMFVSSNLDAAGIAALTFEIWDSSGAVVSDNTIKVTKLLQKGAPVASVDVAPNATAGNYKLVAKVGSDVIATYDFAVTKPATIDSFDVGGDNVTRDDSRSGGKAVTLVAKNSAQITVNITSQAGENTYVIVYDNYPSVKLFGPVKVVNGSFTIDTSTLTPGKHALTVLTSNHMGSNGEYTINDVRTIYVAVEPANKIPVASARFKSATVSGGKVTLKVQAYKDGDNKNNIGTDPLDNDVEYMFSVLKADRANTKAWKIIRGYSTNDTFTWDYQNDPIFINGGGVGKWMLQVYVRNASSWDWVNSFFIITKDLN